MYNRCAFCREGPGAKSARRRVSFADANSGAVVGKQETILRTTTGGD